MRSVQLLCCFAIHGFVLHCGAGPDRGLPAGLLRGDTRKRYHAKHADRSRCGGGGQ